MNIFEYTTLEAKIKSTPINGPMYTLINDTINKYRNIPTSEGTIQSLLSSPELYTTEQVQSAIYVYKSLTHMVSLFESKREIKHSSKYTIQNMSNYIHNAIAHLSLDLYDVLQYEVLTNCIIRTLQINSTKELLALDKLLYKPVDVTFDLNVSSTLNATGSFYSARDVLVEEYLRLNEVNPHLRNHLSTQITAGQRSKADKEIKTAYTISKLCTGLHEQKEQ